MSLRSAFGVEEATSSATPSTPPVPATAAAVADAEPPVRYVYIEQPPQQPMCSRCHCQQCMRREHRDELIFWGIVAIIVLFILKSSN